MFSSLSIVLGPCVARRSLTFHTPWVSLFVLPLDLVPCITWSCTLNCSLHMFIEHNLTIPRITDSCHYLLCAQFIMVLVRCGCAHLMRLFWRVPVGGRVQLCLSGPNKHLLLSGPRNSCARSPFHRKPPSSSSSRLAASFHVVVTMRD